MGWFNKKKKKEEKQKDIPSLPELPKLPDFPEIRTDNSDTSLPQLPSFPNNSVGQEFSNNTIKNAITGKKEGEPVYDANDFEEENEKQKMLKPIKKPLTEEISSLPEQITREIPEDFSSKTIPNKESIKKIATKNEPFFVRIDKFEESLKIFEKTKKQICEIEKMLKDIKELKTEQEKELTLWENKIQTTKQQIEKVDQDIFSKIK